MSTCSKPGCACGGAELPRSTHPYTAVPVERRHAQAWACACLRPDGRRLLRNHRHIEPSECFAAQHPEAVAAWRVAHPEATCSERSARSLAWLAQTFGGRHA